MKSAKQRARFKRMCWLFSQMEQLDHPLSALDAKWFTRNRAERRYFDVFAKHWERTWHP